MTTEEAVIEASDKLLDILLNYKKQHPEFTFLLRTRDITPRDTRVSDDSRLQKGYWFPGSHYIWIGFYKPSDWRNKTRTFGFIINFSKPASPSHYVEWVYNEPDVSHLGFYDRLGDVFSGARQITETKFQYDFKGDDYVKSLYNFLEYYKPKVDKNISELGLVDDFYITEDKFQKGLSRILAIRDKINNPEMISNTNALVKSNDFSLNTILYGPPGTGKTFHSIDKAVEIVNGEYSSDHDLNKEEFDRLRKEGQIEFITFHQNYTYEDFMIGLKPDLEGSELKFKRAEGIFYKLCKRAEQNYRSAHTTSASLKPFEEVLEQFLKPLQEKDEEIKVQMASGKTSFWITDINPSNLSFRKQSGGTNHSLSIDTMKELYESTREFTSGLRYYYVPLLDELWKLGRLKAEKVELKKYVLVIDEINRANISKVFGELITLLEADKRIGEDNELKVSIPHSDKEFGVPPNLYVLGTMNTADKSIALIDIALRRRFEFVGMYPAYEEIEDESARELLKQINKVVYDKKSSADYLIGQAYFMNEDSVEKVLKTKVIPLLTEYFMGKTKFVEEIFKETNWKVTYNEETYSWDIAHP